MLLDSIKNDIAQSLKNRDSIRLNTLRFLLSAIRNAAIVKYGAKGESNMTNQDILDVIKKQIKTRKEAIEAFSKAGRNDLAQKEQKELNILQTFVPKELSDEELKALLEPMIKKSGEQNFGLLMKQAMAAVDGKADGGRVSAMVKTLMSSHA
jgi:uncharacterized protein YqeY